MVASRNHQFTSYFWHHIWWQCAGLTKHAAGSTATILDTFLDSSLTLSSNEAAKSKRENGNNNVNGGGTQIVGNNGTNINLGKAPPGGISTSDKIAIGIGVWAGVVA